MSESKTGDRWQGVGSGEGPRGDLSMCGEGTMRRMAQACGCGPTMAERAPFQEQPGAPVEAAAAGCCGGGDTGVVAGPGGHGDQVA